MQVSIKVVRLFIIIGNTMTVLGCLGLVLVTTGWVAVDGFAIGLTSGVRMIGSLAVAGCLLSAAGYAYKEQIGRKG